VRAALVTALILAAIVWVDLQVPLVGLTPAVRDLDRKLDHLVQDLEAGDTAAARERLSQIRRDWRRMEVGLSLLADKTSRHRFEELLERVDAGLRAGFPAQAAPDAAELRQVWYEILSP